MIFQEIAEIFERGIPEGTSQLLERFSKMPKTAKHAIYEKLYQICNPLRNSKISLFPKGILLQKAMETLFILFGRWEALSQIQERLNHCLGWRRGFLQQRGSKVYTRSKSSGYPGVFERSASTDKPWIAGSIPGNQSGKRLFRKTEMASRVGSAIASSAAIAAKATPVCPSPTENLPVY